MRITYMYVISILPTSNCFVDTKYLDVIFDKCLRILYKNVLELLILPYPNGILIRVMLNY